MLTSVRKSTLLLVLTLIAACGPGGGSGGGGGGGGTTFSPQFQLPADGSTFDSSFKLSVTGTGILRVFFKIDGVTVLEDFDEPFELEIDPTGMEEREYKIVVKAQAPSGKEVSQTIFVTIDFPRIPLAEIQANIAALGPAEWYEIPDTKLEDVAWDEDFRGDVAAIMGAASGGAFDTKRERLIVWGGGSGGYEGNEVYVFDLALAEWIRLNDPADFPPGEENNPNGLVQHPDGSPVQRHSYDAVEYVPEPVDRFVVCGGAAMVGGSQQSSSLSFAFDFDTLTWTTIGDTFSDSNGHVAAVGPDLRVWHQGAGGSDSNKLSVYDPATGMWTEHVTSPGFRSTKGTAEVDPVRNLLVVVGNGQTEIWDLTDPDAPSTILATTGDRELEDTNAPGLAYHPGQDVMVAWNGGDVYTLDLDTAVWTRIPNQGTVQPGPPASRGTYGRWRYVPSRDLFIVANATSANVLVYRLP